MRARFLALVIGILVFVPLAASAQFLPGTSSGADQTPTVEAPSANDIQELGRLLADPRLQDWLKQQVDGAEAARDADDGGTASGLEEQLLAASAQVSARFTAIRAAAQALPDVPQSFAQAISSELRPADRFRTAAFVLVFLVVGAALEWLFRQYTQPYLMRLELRPHADLRGKLSDAAQRSAILLLGLAIFAVGSIGTFSTFRWLPLTQTLVLHLLMIVLILRSVNAVSIFLLAPRVPELRLTPLSNSQSKFFYRWIGVLAVVGCLANFVPDLFELLTEPLGPEAPQPATLNAELIAVEDATGFFAFLVAAAALWHMFFANRPPNTRAKRRPWQIWRAYGFAALLVAFVLWMIGLRSLMATFVILAALPPVLRLLTVWITHLFDEGADVLREQALKTTLEAREEAREKEAAARAEAEASGAPIPELSEEEIAQRAADEQAEEDEINAIDPYANYRPLVLRLIRLAAIICAVIIILAVWGTSIGALSQSDNLIGRVSRVLIDSVVALLIADMIWVWARNAIDTRIRNYKPPEDGGAPGPEARMATLLPLLRTTLLVALLIVVGLTVLSAMGVNVAPLIAGAGVVGIAIGFGTQSLVRDIISGVFFLIDDAFRLGEYIVVDQLRGTVEGITLRSLQLRHHRGQVHTIPFGEIRAVSNFHRDWVIMKLEFRVPFDTDLQLVKKLIKKVGAELLANEHYGPSILSTLKSQGVRRMEEFNMVLGVKFMTKPGEQWLVRRDAYQKVRDAFEANGIHMAERNVKVELTGADPADLTPEQRQQVAAAAHQAVEQQKPPGPVPDEP